MGPFWYALLMGAGVAVSAMLWKRIEGSRPALAAAYLGGLLGALVGAKAGYLLAELPWLLGAPDALQRALYGKTILGGLLGGYGGVELGKLVIGHNGATGDAFARIVPAGLVAGRLGCLLNGCCLGMETEPHWWSTRDAAGVSRFPATALEALFHFTSAALAWALHKKGALRGQLFHVYLMAYGVFRFATELARDTPRYSFGLSPYQALAALLFAFALWRFRSRARELTASSKA